MMHPLTLSLFNSAKALELFQYYVALMNQYFPAGSLFWMIGIVIFVVTQVKTKNLMYAAMIAGLYFILVPDMGVAGQPLITNIYSATAMRFFGLISGLIAGYYLYKIIRG